MQKNFFKKMGIIIPLSLMFLAGCSLPGIKSPAVKVTETPAPTFTPTPSPTPLEIEFHKAPANCAEPFMIARIDKNAKIGDEYYAYSNIYTDSHYNAIVELSLNSKAVDYSAPEIDYNYITQCYLLPFDFNEMKPGEMKFIGYSMHPEYPTCGIEHYNDRIWVNTYIQNGCLSESYDFNANLLNTVRRTNSDYARFSYSENKYYTLENGFLVKHDVENPDNNYVMTVPENFQPETISCIFQNSKGEDCILMYGKGADWKQYNCGINAKTEKCFLLYNGEGYFTNNNTNPKVPELYTYISSTEAEKPGTSTINSYPFDGCPSFSFKDGQSGSVSVLNEKYVAIYYSKVDIPEEVIDDQYSSIVYRERIPDIYPTDGYLVVYDIRENKPVSSLHLHNDTTTNYFISGPILVGPERLLIKEIDPNGTTYLYVWDFLKATYNEEDMFFEVTPNSLEGKELVADIPVIDRYAEAKPSECLPEFADLRKKADELGEKYNVRFFISNECYNYTGGYLCSPLNDRSRIEEALSEFDTELAKYPEGFFRVFKKDYRTGLDFYISSTLEGQGDADTLTYAGGFKQSEGDHINIYLDCSWLGYSHSIHHEICHAIEDMLPWGAIDEDEWNEFNPKTDAHKTAYTYAYDQFGFEDMYGFIVGNTDNNEKVAFYESYSMTQPCEDRATMFERVMAPECYQDYEQIYHYPILMKKLEYLSKAIRDNLATDYWPEVTAWEKPLKEH